MKSRGLSSARKAEEGGEEEEEDEREGEGEEEEETYSIPTEQVISSSFFWF